MLRMTAEPISIGANRVTPRMRVVLKKAAPMMLPNAKLGCPRRMAFTPMVNSGMLVPTATMVAPMTCWETPAVVAIEIAAWTIKLALITTPKAPMMVKRMNCGSLLFSLHVTSASVSSVVILTFV